MTRIDEQSGVDKESPTPRKKKTIRVPERIKFFSTIEDDINAIDFNDMLHEISSKYPGMTHFEDNELSGSRGVMLEFLADEDFVDEILTKYGLTFQDMLSCMYPSYGRLLSNVPFVRKVRKVVLSAAYVTKNHAVF